MKAAVVHDFAHPPRFDDFAVPEPKEDEVIVHVKAPALSQLVKAQASGKHDSSPKQPPYVPGSDGVGLLDSGQRVYFAFLRSSGLKLLGSGLGSVSDAHLLEAIAGVMEAASMAQISIEAESRPLQEVERAWTVKGDARMVITI